MWTYLIIAGLLEPCFAISLKKSDKFRNIPWAAASVVFMAASLYLLSLVMASPLPTGTVYAIWVGIGAVGTLVAGTIIFEERATVMKIFFALLIIIGIAGLQMTSGV
jgi:quaternary ammonium compound-resistance protein SugE